MPAGMNERAARIDRYRTRNLTACAMNEAGWGIAMAFVHYVTILPIFLSALGASAQVIAFIPALTAISYAIPQLLFAHRTAHIEHKRKLLILLHLPAVFGFAVMFAVFYFFSMPPAVGIVVFFAAYFVYTMGVGSVIPVWGDYLTRITNPRWRGRFIGITFTVHSLTGVIGSLWARRVIDAHDFPRGFALGFLAAAVFGGVGALPFLLTKEVPLDERREPMPWGRFASELRQIVHRDRNLVRYLVARTFLCFGLIGLAFFAVYARERTGFALGEAGLLAAVVVFVEGSTCFLWGWLGDRVGYRWVVVGTYSVLLGATLAATAMSTMVGFFVIFIAVGLFRGADWLGHMTMVFEICPREEKSVYFALSNTLLVPPSILIPIAGGAVARWLSYEAAFWLSAAGLAIGLVVLILWVREPRHRPALS
jgi:MFS family permease